MGNEYKLSRRERQILDILFRSGRATVAEVLEAMEDAPAYDSVRTILRILESKGCVRHEQDGPRYVYMPVVSPQAARRDAMRHLVETFFEGSARKAAVELLKDSKLSPDELDELQRLIDRSEEEDK